MSNLLTRMARAVGCSFRSWAERFGRLMQPRTSVVSAESLAPAESSQVDLQPVMKVLTLSWPWVVILTLSAWGPNRWAAAQAPETDKAADQAADKAADKAPQKAPDKTADQGAPAPVDEQGKQVAKREGEGQDADLEKKDEQDGEEQETQQANLAIMKLMASTIDVRIVAGEDSQPTKLIDEPLWRFNAPERDHSDGTVWAWSVGGRPVVLAELRAVDVREDVWGHDLVATHATPVLANIATFGSWKSGETGFAFQPLPQAPVPAATEADRLQQMHDFVRKLTAHEVFNDQRTDLQLHDQPLLRYNVAGEGLIDGGLFAFLAGKNPELLVFVEAQRDEQGGVSWRYALARMSAAALYCQLDGREIYTQPLTFGDRQSPYFAFTRPIPGLYLPGGR